MTRKTRNRFKILILSLVVFVLLVAYVQGSAILKSIKILSGVFSQEKSNFFDLNKPEEVILDETTKLYIFKPGDGRYPAIIFSLGLWETGNDDALENPTESFVKSGFVVVLVESKDTREGFITENSVISLVSGFHYLENQDYVKKDKIGFLGISVGSSLAFIASASPEISDDVLYILWLGGYYDIKDYIVDVFSESIDYNLQVVEYKPDAKIKETMTSNLLELDEVTNKLNSTKDRNELRTILNEAPLEVRQKLDALSPRTYTKDVRAKIFAIHDSSDKLVPFTESIHLNEEMKLERFVLTEIITHAVPKLDVGMIQAVKEYGKLVLLGKDVLVLVGI